MTRRATVLMGVAAVAAIGTAAAVIIVGRSDRPLVDLSREPQTVFATIPFEVGDSYTLGSMAIPSDVPRPVTVSGVRIIHASGVETLGARLFDIASARTGVGLVPGWPPDDLDLVDPAVERPAWPGEVAIVVGLRILEPKSGLRGILVQWVDGAGRAGERMFDLAVLTCAPGVCEVDSADAGAHLKELGLQQ